MIKYEILTNEEEVKLGIAEKDKWDDYCLMLWLFVDDKPVKLIASDGGEPEDNSFGRDWNFVPGELNKLAKRINKLEERLKEADSIIYWLDGEVKSGADDYEGSDVVERFLNK